MIKFNGKDIVPRFNGKDVSRVMYNGKQIYPSNKGIDPATAPNGVYIYSNDGLLYNPDNWDTANNDSAVGVAVVTDDCKFAIDKNLPMINDIPWSNALYYVDVAEIINYSNRNQAITDYNGQNNTNAIINASPSENDTNNAGHYCYAQTLNGQHGYLPALGELVVMYNNKSGINEVLQLLNSNTIDTILDNMDSSSTYHRLFSSTESSSNYIWYLLWNDIRLNTNTDPKQYNSVFRFAFPVFPLT